MRLETILATYRACDCCGERPGFCETCGGCLDCDHMVVQCPCCGEEVLLCDPVETGH
jgi:hypothetical protein